jgi:hypothetical protein
MPQRAVSRPTERGNEMTLCPIAIVAGCRKCPAFKVCPVKGIIGDYTPGDTPSKARAGAGKPGAKRSK